MNAKSIDESGENMKLGSSAANDGLPEPLVPGDCDLQDFQFMPLDVMRLRDSDLAATETPEACWAAVQLWCAAWHQVPAGSIPDDDKWLAKHTGYGRIVKEWMRVRDGALRGWIKCSDGRLYHPVVAEKALEAWQAKLEQRWRSECARIKKHNQRHSTNIVPMQFDEWLSSGRPSGHPLFVPMDNASGPDSVPRDKHSKRQGEGQGQGDSYSVPSGTGGEPPAKSPEQMTKDEIWTVGKSLLVMAGMPGAQCGSFVGKLAKDYGDDIVLEAVRTAVLQRPADPASFLKACCQRMAGERSSTRPNRQEALERQNQEIANRLAEEQAA
jgi:hypothetical protein